MTNGIIVGTMDNGRVLIEGRPTDVGRLSWNDHATFKGVSLKHLVTGKETGGKFSAHIVRVQAGCQIGDHVHADKYELHEVIGGTGTGILEGKEMRYVPGVVAVIPEDLHHSVIAGNEDLYLLAKFIPALL